MSYRVAIVDDEPTIRDAVAYALRSDGFDVDAFETGEGLLEAVGNGDEPDVVVLDLMLPGLSGTEICRRIRGSSPVPIIVLSARDSEVDRVLGLEAGADDYVTKPFSMAELMSRVRAVIRRRELDLGSRANVFRVADLEVDLARHELRVGGAPVRLTPSEFKVLALLAGRPGHVFTRREIMQHLWDSEYVGDQRACDIHVSNIRRKIEADPADPRLLVTIRGIGYKLVSL